MQQRQCVKDRLDQATNVELVELRGTLPQLAQRLAVVVAHSHVSGGVLLPDAVHLNHCRVREARQQLCLTQEIPEPGDEGVAVELRAHHDRLVAGTTGNRRRQVFLDRHRPIQCGLVGEVDDTKATLTDDAGDFEVTQNGADG